MKEVTVRELKEMIDNHTDFQLIDVREEHEYEMANLGGELIPLGTIIENADKISRDKPVIIQCRSGARSGTAVKALEAQFGFTNLANLKGGILAWAQEIDPSLQVS
jgi:rhodanese-related sulfurtransferase